MPRPSLLVSVRNLAEARAAVDGGCDRLDVKEPLHGPLGMAAPDVIAEIATFSREAAGRDMPCSVALGELNDAPRIDAAFAFPRGVTDFKLGPARLGTRRAWTESWQRALGQFQRPSPNRIRRVAVAYADWQRARALPPAEILSAAVEAGADAFLVDTCGKETGSLFDALSVDDLERLSAAVRRGGLMFALAGSLRFEHLAALVNLRPDVIAVRGAACEGQCRSAGVSSASVRRLKGAICELF
jgi:(5-formylfuran-3-yl)methyl phosphate synthase